MVREGIPVDRNARTKGNQEVVHPSTSTQTCVVSVAPDAPPIAGIMCYVGLVPILVWCQWLIADFMLERDFDLGPVSDHVAIFELHVQLSYFGYPKVTEC